MFTINNILRLIVFGVLSLFLVGCTSLQRPTELINVPNEKWRISSIWLSEIKNGWRVTGRLNSPNIFGLPDGHILVSIRSKDGTILDQKKATYKKVVDSGHHSRHQFGSALFTVDFDSIPKNTGIVAEHIIDKKDI